MTTNTSAPPSIDPAVYKTLLESTRAIPWRIAWDTLHFSYIGPQIEVLLGWAPESWRGIDDWAERMHPEDRDRVVGYCVAQSKAGADHEADYRALTADGRYVWIRDVVHVVRGNDGAVEALVGFMFDITERKENEERLLRLQRELEEFSYKDGLTGVANRRLLDSVMEVEWAAARRSSQPLSMLMLDIDCFKEYNDLYGHLAGDDCLRRVARILESAALRPRDVLARFGGEEFVLVLPETDPDAALQVAERCQAFLRDAAIPHEASVTSRLLTVSIGLATVSPAADTTPVSLFEEADRHLYRAKQAGRNRIVTD